MIYNLVFLEKAKKDIEDAFKYYENIQQNLGFKFEDDLYKSIELIEKNTLHFKKIKQENRQLLMSVFSYVVVYQVVETNIIIARVFHTSRNPKYKFKK